MSTILTTMMRMAAQIAQGKLTEARSRLVRSLGVLCIIMVMVMVMVMVVVALAMLAAALAIALSDRIGLVPAMLSIAAGATIIALILALTLRTRADRATTNDLDLPSLAARELRRVDPLIVVVAALAGRTAAGTTQGMTQAPAL